jgi:hypothetical protein
MTERATMMIFETRARLQASHTGFLPLGEEKLKAEYSDWFDRVTGSSSNKDQEKGAN